LRGGASSLGAISVATGGSPGVVRKSRHGRLHCPVGRRGSGASATTRHPSPLGAWTTGRHAVGSRGRSGLHSTKVRCARGRRPPNRNEPRREAGLVRDRLGRGDAMPRDGRAASTECVDMMYDSVTPIKTRPWRWLWSIPRSTVATVLDVTPRSVYNWRTGRHRPRPRNAKKLRNLHAPLRQART
jgi:hypothetical protein